jgi:hypothetical protein
MKKTLFIMTALIFSFLATIALADTKIYPGSMCVRWNSGQPVPTLNNSAIFNNSNSWLYVDCPFIMKGTRTFSSWVKLADRNFNANVCCTQAHRYQSGATYFGWTGPQRCTNGTSTFPYTYFNGPLFANANTHGYFSCSVPPRYGNFLSGIHSYKVTD